MDFIDIHILLPLDWNCRLPYQALAEKLGLTAPGIKKRMERLAETGVFKEFSRLGIGCFAGCDQS